jgi:hypothetical protein
MSFENTFYEQQLTLFPTRDSVELVEAEGVAMLPITEPNDLIALLRLHENTILKGEHHED